MAEKKSYIKPEVIKYALDPSVTQMQAASPPGNPNPMMMPTGTGNKGNDTPFASPFDDKPFG